MQETVTHGITVGIGGLHVRICSPCETLLHHIQNVCAPFISDDQADFRIHLAFPASVTPSRFLSIPATMFSRFLQPSPRNSSPRPEATPHDRTPAPGCTAVRSLAKPDILARGDRIVVQRHDFVCVMEPDQHVASALVHPHTEEISVETILRICFSFLAIRKQGLLLHSGGLVRNGRGYLFPGPSETGKSTLIGMAGNNDTVLSDELVLVRRQSTQWHAFSTPFYGTNRPVKQNTHTRLDAVCLPIKSTEVSLRNVTPHAAFRKLLVCVVSPGGRPAMNQALLDLCLELAAEVPCFDLQFRKDPSFWTVLDTLHEKEHELRES